MTLPTDLQTLLTAFAASRSVETLKEVFDQYVDSMVYRPARISFVGLLQVSVIPLKTRREMLLKTVFTEYDLDDTELRNLDNLLENLEVV